MITRFGPIAALASALVVGAATNAQAGVETLRWSQGQQQNVAGFRFYWGASPGSYPNVQDVGRPAPDSSGTYSVDLALPDSVVYVVATAYDSAGLESAFSNVKQFGSADGGEPPPVEPPPPDDPPPDDPPPDDGAIWSTSFDGITGSDVPGWLDTGARNSLSAGSADLFFVSNSVMQTASEELNIHSHFVGPGSSVWSDYQLSGRMQVGSANGSVGVTAYSAFPQQDVYYKLFRIGTAPEKDFWIVGHPDIACSAPRTGVTPAPLTWYRFRLEVTSSASANTIRARVWPAGTSEPAGWQATCVDSSASRPTSGTIGLWSRGEGGKYWDDLAVVPLDAGEVPAPPPEPGVGQPGRPRLVLD